jgi:hypothetical protein
MDLDGYRRAAEQFISELELERYRHYAGLKDEYEIEPIYARHGWLFTRESVNAIRSKLAAAAPGSEQQRRLRMLTDFAVEGYIGEDTKTAERELASREASMTIDVDGERMSFRASAVAQANEPDAGRRALIEAARVELVESELGTLYRELLERQHDCARTLGWRSYVEMSGDCKGVDLAALAAQTAEFSAATERVYPRLLEPEVRRTFGFGLDRLRRADLSRFFRAPDEDRRFPAERLLPAFAETLRQLGIDPLDQRNIILDLRARPKKSPRAFCAAVRTPGEVYLMVAPVGGRDDFSALFHEGGHAEHAAHVDPALPFEFRYLGDNAITECYAFLFEHLIEDREWLERRLGVDDVSALLSRARAERLVYVRRYAAKLAYELELHGGEAPVSFPVLAERYSDLLGAAVMVRWPAQTFLADVDPGFYCACYLRAWALETHVRWWLRDRYGPRWFESVEAGASLRRLWRNGQRLTPEELLAQMSGGALDFHAMLADLELAPADR